MQWVRLERLQTKELSNCHRKVVVHMESLGEITNLRAGLPCYTAGGRQIDARKSFEEHRFPGTVWTDDSDNLLWVQNESDTVDGHLAVERDGEVLY